MYEENRTGSVIKDVLLQVILVVIFVFLLLWLFPTKGYVDNKLKDGLDPLYQELFNEHLETMKDAAQSYFTKERLPKKVSDKVSLTLGEMLDKKLLSTFVDSNNKQCSLTGSYVEITKMDKEYMMKVNLNCSDKSDYIIVYLGCYNYCEDYLCESNGTQTSNTTTKPTTTKPSTTKPTTTKPTQVVTKYEYEYELVTEGKYTDWSKWSSWSTKKKNETNYVDVDTKVEWEVVDTEKISTGTKVTYVNAEKGDDKIYDAKKVVKCPTGYTQYSEDSKMCIGEPIKTQGTTQTVVTNNEVDAIVTQVKVCPDGRITTNDWCFATVTNTDSKTATAVQTYGNWVYSGRQTYVGTKTNNNTTKYTFVSSKDELDCTNGCKSVTKNTYDVYTRKASTTYNCNSYPGYTLSGTKCVKNVTSTTSVYGTWTIQNKYSCSDGSTPVNGKCTVAVTTTQTTASKNTCEYGSYDASMGWCYTRGTTEYECPYNLEGKIEGTKCIVESTKYTCDEGKLVEKRCKITKTTYKTQKFYGYVTYYRYRTRDYISGNVSKVWSSSDEDKDLIELGFVLTGNKKEVK